MNEEAQTYEEVLAKIKSFLSFGVLPTLILTKREVQLLDNGIEDERLQHLVDLSRD